ncbi:MAG: hypothetical protein Q8P18_25580 [Pseudomonadota bacterium]|nr:hypothetical protein [Pseudomonadota bacterium]
MLWLLPLLACTAPSHEDLDTRGLDDSAAPAGDSTANADTERPHTETGETGGTDTGPAVPPPCDVWAEPRDVGSLADADRSEVSGVAPSVLNPGVLWILEDHGNDPAFYAIDLTGAPLGTLSLEGAENVDWEAIALGPCPTGTCLWAADVGDNALERTEVALYRVPEPEVGWGGGLDATLVAERFPLVYPDGAENVEAFLLTPEGMPVLLTKRGDGESKVYVVDDLVPDVGVVPRLVGRISTRDPEAESGGIVTSADLWPDGSRLLVRTYDSTWEFELGEAGLEGVIDAPRLPLPHAEQQQVEAVAYDAVLGGYWQIAEGPSAFITFVACLG